MTQEQKAKAYDEAKYIMEEYLKSGNAGVIAENTIKKAFPELKESEDERIREGLLEHCRKQSEIYNTLLTAKEYSEVQSWIAWLEKQGNLMKALQISNAKIGELIEENYYLKEQLEKQRKNNMGISEATKQKLEDNLNKALEKETPESWNKFLDEQGEQKPVFEMKTPEESLGIDSETYSKIVDECIYGEQKPIKEHNACEFCEDKYGCVNPCSMKLIEEEKFTNKVEPKFKIEEEKWYVCTQTFVLRGKIVVIKGQTYQAEKDNVIKGEDGCLFIDKHDGKASDYFRLWTIQDAKDGDVLCGYPKTDYPWIGIFHNLNTEGTFNSYCFLQAGQHGKFCPPSEENIFGKRNIDNHISEDIVPATKEQHDLLFQKMKEAGYEWDSEKKELKKIEQKPVVILKFRVGDTIKNKKTNKIFTISDYSLLYEYYHDINHYHEIKFSEQDDWELVEQNPAWGEEDERMCKTIIDNIQAICKEGYFVGSIDSDELIKWLKFLKERYVWKPSDEQMDALHYVTNFDYGGYKATLVSLYEQLKKLRGE